MISAILLGAGESKRMGVNKLLLPWGRKTVFEHCLNTLLRSRIREVIVVVNDRIKEAVGPVRRKKLKLVINPDYKKGMSTSIRKGLKRIDPRSDGILISLGDQPVLKTRTVNALVRAFGQGEGKIVVPSFRGRKGHPVIFHRRYKKELLTLKGDMGGRSILLRYPERIKTVPVRSEGVIRDIDTWKDYKNGLRRRS